VLKLKPWLAPIKIGVFPLVNKLKPEARKVFDSLKNLYTAQFDTSGSIGRRYARADEIGIPYCITVDFDTKTNKSITIRDRDTTSQIRVKLKDLNDVLYRLFTGKTKFEKAGKPLKK